MAVLDYYRMGIEAPIHGSKKRGMEFRERFVNCDKRVRLSLHLNVYRTWGGPRYVSSQISLSLSQ